MACRLWKFKKTHLETLNMGLGVHGRRSHMASRDLHRGDLAQVYGFWFIIKNKQIFESCLCQTNSRWFFSTFIVISKQSFDMHLTFAAAYQRNKIMFNNQTLQNIKIVVLRSMFSIQGPSPGNSRHLRSRHLRSTRTNKELKILDQFSS